MEQGIKTPNAAVVTAALSRALASPVFVQAQRQSRLLRYIVEESAAGRGGRLNQFSLGIDALDRGADFDPTTDSGVRVEVGRLRSKLREYYETYPDEPVVFRYRLVVHAGTSEEANCEGHSARFTTPVEVTWR